MKQYGTKMEVFRKILIESTGCYPSESELQHLVSEMEGEGTTPLVTLQKFVPPVCGILQQKR